MKKLLIPTIGVFITALIAVMAISLSPLRSTIPSNVAIPDIINILWTGTIILAIVLFALSQEHSVAPKIPNGLPATAKIIHIEDTGTAIMEKPVLKFILDVYINNEKPYQTSTKALLRPEQFQAIGRDMMIDVIYDPENPERVRITQFEAKAKA